jgi:hypothetical protein
MHGELKMLGISISERTVSRILRTVPRPPSQPWKTFLRNHLGQIVTVDFFFLLLEHRCRGFRRSRNTSLCDPRSGWRLGNRGTEASEVNGHCAAADSASKPQAERLRRALDRIDTTGVFESFHHSEQPALEEDACFIFPLRLPITPKDRERHFTGLTCSYERILRRVPTRARNCPTAFWPFIIRPIARLLSS